MTFTDKTAIDFFITKILDQAKKDNITISKAQEYVLSLNSSDPDSYSNEELINSFENEAGIKQFEINIMGLISRAYRHDISNNSSQLENYRAAHRILQSGNYYLNYMVNRTIGSKISKIGHFFENNGSDRAYLLRAIFIGFLTALQLFSLVLSLISARNITEFNVYSLLWLILSIGLTAILFKGYLRLTRKGLYDYYIKEQIQKKAGHFSKQMLNAACIFPLFLALLINRFTDTMAALKSKDYGCLIFESIGLILYTFLVIAILVFLSIELKSYFYKKQRF
jgi:hypothetical protein